MRPNEEKLMMNEVKRIRKALEAIAFELHRSNKSPIEAVTQTDESDILDAINEEEKE